MSEEYLTKDEEINSFKKDKLNQLSIVFLQQIRLFGSWEFYLLVTFLFFLFLRIEIFLFLFVGFGFIHVVGIPFRIVFFKNRPKPITFDKDNLIEKINASSLPSFHAARSMFMVLIFAYYFKNVFFIVLGILLVAFVSYSRVYFKKHYWSDIVGGFFLAVFCFLLIIWFWYNIILFF